MIYKYLKLLAEQGRMEEQARILAPEQLFDTAILDVRLAEAVDAMLLDLEQQAEQRSGAVRAQNGHAGRAGELDHPAAKDLIAQIDVRTAEYLKRWRHQTIRSAASSPNSSSSGVGARSHAAKYNIRTSMRSDGRPYSILGRSWEAAVQWLSAAEDAAGIDRDWGARHAQAASGCCPDAVLYTHWTIPLERPACDRDGVRRRAARLSRSRAASRLPPAAAQ